MSTKYIASNWRLPNEENSNKSDNYGLSFDGSEFINCGSSSALLTTGAFSVSFWMKTTVTANDALVLMDDWSAGNRNWQILHLSSGNVIRFYVFGSPNAFVLANTSINDGNWHHVVCTYEPSTALRIYIDGSLDNSNTTSIPATRNNSAANLRIGKDDFNAYYTGSISEVAVFDYVLSSTQISTLYGSSELGSTSPMALKPQPISYYPLGDNSASNPLTQPNEAVEDASVFDFVSSSSQYIDCGIPSFLNSTSVFTSSLWFNTNDVGTQTTLWANGSSASQLWVISKYQDDLIIYGGTSTKYYRKNNLFSINTWYNLIVIYDGSQANADRFKVYLNGVLLTGATINGTIETITPTFTTNLNIGRIGYAAASYFNGEISNTVFWNSDQTTEISNIYNSGVPATTYTNTPTAWYKLDQSANWDVSGSGNWTIPDASGNGNDGTSSGMTSANLVLSDLTRAVPYDSYSFNFDSASSDYIDCGNNFNFGDGTNDSPFSISAWINMTSTSGFRIFNRYDGSNYEYSFGTGGSNKLQFFIFDTISAYRAIVMTTVLNTGQWYHVAVTYSGVGGQDAQDGMIIYVDGVPATVTETIVGTYQAMPNLSIDAYIGKLDTSYTNGKISNVAIFDEALTSTEVLKLYSNGVPQDLSSFSPAPISWYTLGSNSFWNGSNWICRDLIGSNDGTSANAGADAIVGDAPRSEANGTGTNMDIPTNLEGSTKWSDNNSWSINMSETARVEDTP